MKTTKLIIGIISIVLSLFVLFQGCTATVRDALADDGSTAGVAGTILAIFLMIAGTIAVATCNGKAGGIVASLFYLLAGVMSTPEKGSYFTDLEIWGTMCYIFAAVFLFGSIFFIKKAPKQNTKKAVMADSNSTVVLVDDKDRKNEVSDEQFEYYCDYLLKSKYYFKRVQVPVKTNDRTCDLVAYRKDGTAWIVFCIKDGSSVGYEVIDKLISGKSEHRAQYMAIMTSTHVSNGIRAYAKEKDVVLFEDISGNISAD